MRRAPRIAFGQYLLRPWDDADIDFAMRAARDPDIKRYSSVGEAATQQLVQAWIESRTSSTRFDWVVEESTVPVGRVSLAHVDLDDGVAEVGYWVLAPHRRRGVASAALGAIETYAFESLELYRLFIRHEVENEPSCALATSRGYLAEGTQRGAFERAGARRDLHVHALLVSDDR